MLRIGHALDSSLRWNDDIWVVCFSLLCDLWIMAFDLKNSTRADAGWTCNVLPASLAQTTKAL